MSWLGDLGGLTGNLDAPGAAAYARGAIIGGAARAGWSGAQTLRQLRGLGIGIRTQDFYSTWRDIRGQVAAGQTSAMVPPGVTDTSALGAAAPEGWTGRYTHQVTATYRYTSETGERVLVTRTMGLVSDNLLSPIEASQAALGLIEANGGEETEGGYPQAGEVLSLSLTGQWYQSRPGILGRLT